MNAHEGYVIHWARLYDLGSLLSGGRLRPGQRQLLARAAIRPGENVLDVGCGPGRITAEAARQAGPGARVLGIDPSPEMIALAKDERGSVADFERAPIQAIPAGDATFDVALASLVLHHVPAGMQAAGLRELRRVLKPGGRFLALDFAASASHGPGLLLAALGLRRGLAHAEHLRSLLVEAGFDGVQIERSGRAYCLLSAWKPAER